MVGSVGIEFPWGGRSVDFAICAAEHPDQSDADAAGHLGDTAGLSGNLPGLHSAGAVVLPLHDHGPGSSSLHSRVRIPGSAGAG